MKLVPVMQDLEPGYTGRCLSLIEKTFNQLLEHPDLPEMFAYLDTVSSVSLGRFARKRHGPQLMELLFAISYTRKPGYEQFRERLSELLALIRNGDAISGCFTDPQTRHLHFTFNEFSPELPSGSVVQHPRNSAVVVSEGTNYLLIELRFNSSRLRAVV